MYAGWMKIPDNQKFTVLYKKQNIHTSIYTSFSFYFKGIISISINHHLIILLSLGIHVWDVVVLETPTNTCHYRLSVVCAVEIRRP
jgi:hypothetical protein